MTTLLDFRPHPFFPGGHLQTLAGFYWPQRPVHYRATPTAVDVSGGDQIVLHDDCPTGWRPNDRVVLLIHGLAGCHGSPYMVRIAEKLNQRGIRSYRMDMRGCGAAAGKARLPGHAGRHEDVAAAITTIAQQCPNAPLTVVGFSMGGNLALNALAEAAHAPMGNLCAGIAVAPPVDLARCCRELQNGLRRGYDAYLVRHLVNAWRRTGGTVPAQAPTSIYQFDDEITAPQSGFRDAEDYYAHASSGTRLQEIHLPTKILAAMDDPVVSFAAIEQAPCADAVQRFATRSGGHLGFMGRSNHARDGRWLDQQIVQWVTSSGGF